LGCSATAHADKTYADAKTAAYAAARSNNWRNKLQRLLRACRNLAHNSP